MAGRRHVFDLDTRPWSGEQVKQLRESTPRTHLDRMFVRRPQSEVPTMADMASRVGVHMNTWHNWERWGVNNGWAPLLHLWQEEGHHIAPVKATLRELESLWELLGETWSGLAHELGCTRQSLNDWRQRFGYVPAHSGYGRLVRICCQDMLGSSSLIGSFGISREMSVGAEIWLEDPGAKMTVCLRVHAIDRVTQTVSLSVINQIRQSVQHSSQATLKQGVLQHVMGNSAKAMLHPKCRVTHDTCCLTLDVAPHIKITFGGKS